MVYIHDGTIVDKPPFSMKRMFWGIFNFFYLMFRTLIDPKYSPNDKQVTGYHSKDGGPPKPPRKRFGGFPSIGGGGSPPPPMPGSCGCGL